MLDKVNCVRIHDMEDPEAHMTCKGTERRMQLRRSREISENLVDKKITGCTEVVVSQGTPGRQV